MKKKGPPPETETFIIGPSCCGSFSSGKDLCSYCVVKGLYKSAICFTPPTVGKKGADYEEELCMFDIDGAQT